MSPSIAFNAGYPPAAELISADESANGTNNDSGGTGGAGEGGGDGGDGGDGGSGETGGGSSSRIGEELGSGRAATGEGHPTGSLCPIGSRPSGGVGGLSGTNVCSTSGAAGTTLGGDLEGVGVSRNDGSRWLALELQQPAMRATTITTASPSATNRMMYTRVHTLGLQQASVSAGSCSFGASPWRRRLTSASVAGWAGNDIQSLSSVTSSTSMISSMALLPAVRPDPAQQHDVALNAISVLGNLSRRFGLIGIVSDAQHVRITAPLGALARGAPPRESSLPAAYI